MYMYLWENWSFVVSKMCAKNNPWISFWSVGFKKRNGTHLQCNARGFSWPWWDWKYDPQNITFQVHKNKPLAASAFLIASSSAFSLALVASTSLSRAAMGLRYSGKNVNHNQSIHCDWQMFWWLFEERYRIVQCTFSNSRHEPLKYLDNSYCQYMCSKLCLDGRSKHCYYHLQPFLLLIQLMTIFLHV